MRTDKNIRQKIFIVEDQKLIVADLENTLRKLGYVSIGNAASGEEVIAKIKVANPNLVLMDISLRGEMDGIDAASLVREHFDIPVVYLTAFGDEETIERAKATNPYGYIVKPFNERELRATIEIALFRHQVDRRMADALVQQRALEEFISMFRQAQRAIQARDELISTAAHELKTPLTSLCLLVELVSRELDEVNNQETSKKMALMQRQITQITQLVDRLFDTARISSGQMVLQKEEFDFATMVTSVIEGVEVIAHRAGSSITVDAATAAAGNWDRLRLEQAVGNLLSNALKYGGGLPIEVSVTSTQNEVILKVSDSGIGMTSETIEKVFNRYERGPNPQAHSGLGLGLFLTDEIVKAHGGSLEVKSKPGAGSTFTMRVPRK